MIESTIEERDAGRPFDAVPPDGVPIDQLKIQGDWTTRQNQNMTDGIPGLTGVEA